MFGREASKRLFAAEVTAMDSYDVMNLPDEVSIVRHSTRRRETCAGLQCPRLVLLGSRASLPLSPALPHQSPPQELVVFMISTTGDGEIPDNAKSFWKFLLRRDLPADSLSGLQFSVCGLGDSGYAKFNAAARKLHTRLLQLGAQSFADRCLGDDRSPYGVAGDIDRWSGKVWGALEVSHPPPPGVIIDTAPQLLRCRLQVAPVSNGSLAARVREAEGLRPHPLGAASAATFEVAAAADDGGNGLRQVTSPLEAVAADVSARPSIHSDNHTDAPAVASSGAPSSPSNAGHPASTLTSAHPYAIGRVLENRRLTASDWSQDVRHVSIVLGRTGLRYGAGDVAVIHPSNPPDQVEALAKRLGLELDAVVEIVPRTGTGAAAAATDSASTKSEPKALDSIYSTFEFDALATLNDRSEPPHLPRFASIRHLLSCCLDIFGVPRRGAIEQLAFFARDPEHKEKLFEMATAEGADIFHSYCTQERRTYVELLQDFDSISIPLPYLLDRIPLLQPRHYSIASSPSECGNSASLELCIAIVEYKTKFGRDKRGVCSSWFQALNAGDAVPVYIRTGLLSLAAIQAKSAAAASSIALGAASRAGQTSQQPLIMIGPGTGLAPMRSIYRELMVTSPSASKLAGSADAVSDGTSSGHLNSSNSTLVTSVPCYLFFGCRRKEKDWLYGAESTHAVKAGSLHADACCEVRISDVVASRTSARSSTAAASATFVVDVARVGDDAVDVAAVATAHSVAAAMTAPGLQFYDAAFSRDSPDGQKVYVQHRLAAHASLIARLLLEQQGRVLIAGSAEKMPTEVVDVLKQILRAHGPRIAPALGFDGDPKAVDRYIAAMERDKRLVIEAWS